MRGSKTAYDISEIKFSKTTENTKIATHMIITL